LYKTDLSKLSVYQQAWQAINKLSEEEILKRNTNNVTVDKNALIKERYKIKWLG